MLTARTSRFRPDQDGPGFRVLKGGYTLWNRSPARPGNHPHRHRLRNVACLRAAQKLGAEGRAARAVSLPSWALFEAQTQAYKTASCRRCDQTRRGRSGHPARLGALHHQLGQVRRRRPLGGRLPTNASSRNTPHRRTRPRRRQKPALRIFDGINGISKLTELKQGIRHEEHEYMKGEISF